MTLLRLACILVAPLAVLCGQSLDAMFVLETFPGTEQAIGLIRPRAFQDADRAGVIGFDRTAQVLQPLTEDREALAGALQRAGFRVGVAIKGVQIRSDLTVDLVGALRKAFSEFGRHNSTERKRAIIVFFASEDPRLSAHFDDLKVTLRTANARLYAVVVQRVDGREAPTSPRIGAYPFPVMTAQFMSRLTAESGGRIYKKNWDLTEILAEARKP